MTATPSNRLDARLADLRAASKKGLITFITAGFPAPSDTVAIMRTMVEGGADVIELGVPFSDPMADGPSVQRSSEAALAAGMTLAKTLHMVEEFRRQDTQTPVVLMTYLNPVEAMGYASFAARAAAAGVDGLIVVDLPAEEAAEVRAALNEHDLREVFLIAPTTTPDRIAVIRNAAGGFVYYVSIKGITGTGRIELRDVAEHVAGIREQIDLPIAVGFAIRDAATAAAVAAVSDAVVVGSAIVDLFAADAAAHAPLLQLLRGMRAAMDGRPA